MQIKMLIDTQTWTKPGGKEGGGNKGVIVKAGTIHLVVDNRNGYYAIDIPNRWIPAVTCVPVGVTPPPVLDDNFVFAYLSNADGSVVKKYKLVQV